MEWKEVRLGDVCDLVAGYAFKAKDFGDFPHKVIKIGDINPPFVNYESELGVNLENYDTRKLEKYLVRYDDFVLAMTGATIGKVGRYVAQGPSYLNQRVLLFKAKENVCSKLLYYIVTSPIFAKYVVNHIDSESAQPNISAGTISKYELQIPSSIDDQRRISSILSSLDRKIELNTKINATLEEMAQALFKSWFVDFEPFKNGNFIDTEIGEIPEGWRVAELSEVCMFDSGYSYKGAELQASSNAMATIKNFDRKGGFKIDGYKEIIVSPKVKPSQFVNLFDILVAHTDLTQNAEIVGNPAIVLHKGGYEQLIMSMDLVKVTSKAKELSFGLLYSILKSPAFKQHALGYVNGTTVLHMSKKALPEYVLAMPNDLASIKGLSDTLDNIFKRIASNMQETLTLTHLRDTLLPLLMSGEIEL